MIPRLGWSNFGFRLRRVSVLLGVLLGFALHAPADGSSINVVLDVAKAGPRSVEDATRNRITADYRFAWAGIAQALEANTVAPLQGSLMGNAKTWLSETVTRQKQSGLTTLYTDQNHKVRVAFYAPEGDVIELHDTAEYGVQVLDRGKTIHDQRVVQRYVVLMTPAADRWVIRELQAVSQF